MYIEKLTDKELKDIFKMILNIVDKDNADVYVNNHRMVRGYDGTWVNFVFNTGYEEQMVCLTDYTASATYGYITTGEAVKVAYRRYMYEKFGKEYYECLRDTYKYKIESEREQKLSILSKELDDITR